MKRKKPRRYQAFRKRYVRDTSTGRVFPFPNKTRRDKWLRGFYGIPITRKMEQRQARIDAAKLKTGKAVKAKGRSK